MAFSKEIRILQMVDSLEAGGAERMAVNYANALEKRIGFGGLVATRGEGSLKNQLVEKVTYCFLNRKRTLDLKALWKLRKFVITNKITHIHAHSSSVFFSVFLKLVLPKTQIIWHDHYGKSEMLDKRPNLALRIASLFINEIISVNNNLKNWANEKLWCKKVLYLPNFASDDLERVVINTILSGEDGKRIVCLANLRPQKNHQMLLKVAKVINEVYPDWTFHLVGKDFNDLYSKSLKDEIEMLALTQVVFVYGSKEDISGILKQASIGVLTSLSEGLPVAVLEYGLHKLPVVATSVGEIPMVLEGNSGLLVESNHIDDFVLALEKIMNNSNLQNRLASNLNEKILKNYSETAVIELYLNRIYEN